MLRADCLSMNTYVLPFSRRNAKDDCGAVHIAESPRSINQTQHDFEVPRHF